MRRLSSSSMSSVIVALVALVALLLLVATTCLAAAPASAAAATTRSPSASPLDVDALLRFAAQQYDREYAQWLEAPDQYPHFGAPTDAMWTNTNSYQPFTAGFYPGILWQLHAYFALINDTAEAATWLARAVAVTPGNAPAANLTDTHDIGFVITNSFINGYRATQNASYLPVIEQAARSLATRYSPIVQCTRSWNSAENFLVIIDNMMNIELLNWAGTQFGNVTWSDMAWHHANRTMSAHFRPDFSTYQVVEFNETDGTIIAFHTKQGLNVTSTWTRGQGWAIWGYTRAYAYTQYAPFLERAVDAATLFVTRLHAESPDSVPWWDFDAPYKTGDEPHDSSAGAIAASGMMELGHTLEQLGIRASFDFVQESLNILGNLSSAAYSLEGHAQDVLPAVLGGATGNRPSNLMVNVSIIWGDYYYVEALVRYATWYVVGSSSSSSSADSGDAAAPAEDVPRASCWQRDAHGAVAHEQQAHEQQAHDQQAHEQQTYEQAREEAYEQAREQAHEQARERAQKHAPTLVVPI